MARGAPSLVARRRRAGCALAAVGLSLLAARAAAATDPRLADYERLQQWRCGPAVAVPAGGLEISRDVARLHLDSGTLRFLEPTADGRLTGLLFEGRASFAIAVPDPVELRQLRRFTGQPALERLETPVSRLVLRSSEAGLLEHLLAAPPPDGPFATGGPCALARERHENWLTLREVDADARVVAGLETPGDEYLRFEMETPAYGWLTFTFDGQEPEEVQLVQFSSAGGGPFTEFWLSLDRASERDPGGRPGPPQAPPLSIPRVELRLDLTRAGREAQVGSARTSSIDARVEAALTVVPRTAARALRLRLHPWAEVAAVRDAGGRPLAFLRDRTGRRRAGLEDWISDPGLVVLLERPAEPGRELHVTVEYRMDLLSYAPGRAWYPGLPTDVEDLHTARLEITAPGRLDVRASGSERERHAAGKNVVTTWEVDRPTAMLTWTTIDHEVEQTAKAAGVPDVVASANRTGATRNQVWNVAADVSNSLQFFQKLYAVEIPAQRLLVTSIAAGHGQSFDGLLELAEGSFNEESEGPNLLFRAHETAHQIFGHLVRVPGYRDQWLSEAFAEYSALLFLEASSPKGPKLAEQALTSWSDELNGSLRSAMSRFARPWLLALNTAHRGRLGPIALGYRAATAEVRDGYMMQSYERGAYVLHMLRGLLRRLTKSDDAFFRLLRDFVHSRLGQVATTADFQAALERQLPGDWSWFFDDWVWSAETPTYRWSWTTRPGPEGKTLLVLHVRTEGVGARFRMPVPVHVELEGGKTGDIVVNVDGPEKSLEVPLPQRPRTVIFNPDRAVLAVVRKE